ncbi:putative peroxiredoxin bcp [Prevotella corporis]|uniref:thioredoxin-dependent peroxiredoxin n=2 Tax=Prevotella corporis TaxID=28128 RepID=A0A133Q9A9_9BACT|nr:putative peroxiredoxin bcp [Prevotella corporis]
MGIIFYLCNNLLKLKIMMEIGDKVPEILGTDQDGKQISLSDFKGKKLVLYFYPKDSTPGCTSQACNLRDNYELMMKRGYAVVGVSVQDEKSHKKFIEKYNLPFPLIADVDKKLNEAFGVYGEKKMYGRSYMGTFRTTFIIGTDGTVEEIFTPKQIKVKEHAEQILAAAEQK